MRKRLMMKYHLTEDQMNHIDDDFLWQLFMCRSDEARRILLGKSR